MDGFNKMGIGRKLDENWMELDWMPHENAIIGLQNENVRFDSGASAFHSTPPCVTRDTSETEYAPPAWPPVEPPGNFSRWRWGCKKQLAMAQKTGTKMEPW